MPKKQTGDNAIVNEYYLTEFQKESLPWINVLSQDAVAQKDPDRYADLMKWVGGVGFMADDFYFVRNLV